MAILGLTATATVMNEMRPFCARLFVGFGAGLAAGLIIGGML